MDVKEIKQLAKIVKENELTKFMLKDGEFELKLERGGNEKEQVFVQAPSMMQSPMPVLSSAPVPAGDETALTVEDDSKYVEVTSPIVGTFYRAPSPDSDVYVNVGDQVHEESVVCIVEAMKVMNEIHSEVSGIIREILVDNATPIQFGEPLFLVEPS
jgi:acetyl-CoA carboxylase biotin carboxyl carrier protein